MDILKDKIVTIRKPHMCFGCGNVNEPKTKMRFTVSVDAGNLSSAYWCITCDKIIQKYYDDQDLQDGLQFKEVIERFPEAWKEFNKRKEG